MLLQVRSEVIGYACPTVDTAGARCLRVHGSCTGGAAIVHVSRDTAACPASTDVDGSGLCMSFIADGKLNAGGSSPAARRC